MTRSERDQWVRKGLLSVRTVADDDRYVVALAGELDLSTVDFLVEEVKKAEASASREIILDLSELTFMDSEGVRVILAAQTRSGQDPDRIGIARGPRRVQRVFELTDTESLLRFVN